MKNDANKGLTVEWNHLHKPYRVTTAQSITTYRYDPLGRRLSKVTNDTSRTLYARDPQGNALATYRKKSDQEIEQETQAAQAPILTGTDPFGNPIPGPSVYVNPLKLTELVIYGSSRIGIINLDAKATKDEPIEEPCPTCPVSTNPIYSKKKPSNSQNVVIFTEVLGLRRYEISNHLGNVLATYTDRKLWRRVELQDGSKWEGYDCDVASGTDYHAYGFAMAGRTWEGGGTYRYGMNTQEKSPEIGDGHYTAQFWEYDSGLARRWELDPRPNVSISGYAVFGGNPIVNVDVLGDTVKFAGELEEKTYNNMRSTCKRQIANLSQALSKAKESGNKEAIANTEKELAKWSEQDCELDQLENSTDVYKVRMGENISFLLKTLQITKYL